MSRADTARRYKHEYYRLARSLGLCGRCKGQEALPGMAYCLPCRTATQAYNHARCGTPTKKYESKFTALERLGKVGKVEKLERIGGLK